MIDVHHNILPGFSKGPASMEEAVLMARLAEREGITTVIATPTYHPDQSVLKETIINQSKELNAYLMSEGVHVHVIPAQHVPVYSELLEDYEAGRLLSVNDKAAYLFLNFPQRNFPLYAEHFIGSCAHKLDRKGIGLKQAYQQVGKVFGNKTMDMFQTNAQALIDGLPIYLLEPTRVKRKSSLMYSLFGF